MSSRPARVRSLKIWLGVLSCALAAPAHGALETARAGGEIPALPFSVVGSPDLAGHVVNLVGELDAAGLSRGALTAGQAVRVLAASAQDSPREVLAAPAGALVRALSDEHAYAQLRAALQDQPGALRSLERARERLLARPGALETLRGVAAHLDLQQPASGRALLDALYEHERLGGTGETGSASAAAAAPRPARGSELSESVREAARTAAGIPAPRGQALQGPKRGRLSRLLTNPGAQVLATMAASAAFGKLYFGLFLGSPEAMRQFFSTYLIEWSMSLDNMVVISGLIAAAAPEVRRWAVPLGLLGTIAARMIMVTFGVGLVASSPAMFYLFGAFLVALAPGMFKKEWDVKDLLLKPVRAAAAALGLRRLGAGLGRSWPFLQSRWFKAAALGALITGAGVVFAFDSVPAALAVSKSASVILWANAFSLIGLGALLSVFHFLEKHVPLMPKGVAGVLLFVGGKMILETAFAGHGLSSLASLAIILALLGLPFLAALPKLLARLRNH